MTKYTSGGLSHHEELRYFYLLRNLTYLSENEKREFAFLKSKMEAGRTHSSSSKSRSEVRQPTSYPVDDYYQGDYPKTYLDQTYTEEGAPLGPSGLPLYPREEKRRSKRQAKVATRQAMVSQEPVYGYCQEYPQDLNPRYGDYTYQEDYADPTPLPKTKKRSRKKKSYLKGFFKLIGLLLLVMVLGLGFMFAKGIFEVSTNKVNYKPAVSQAFNGKETKDGTNILILGSDQRVTQGSTEARTDTIMVVNVGNKDKKTKMVSFMRDTLVNIPGYSYNDNDSYDLKLNTSFNLGEQENHHGAEFVRQTLKHNFDIDIKYYVMVDFETFAEAIDTLFPNGVTIDAKFATVGGVAVDSVEVPDDLRMKDGVVPNQTIDVGEQQMDGRTLLNYARFRKDDEGDFGRTVRQQQVMSAVMSQIKDPAKLFTGSAAIGKIYALTSTNVSFPFVLKNGVSILGSGKNGVEHVTIPENGDWVDEYDMYGGQALHIDFDKYQKTLAKLGLR
uniref:LCP family protein n=1 Tax=Streptococcus canis TaxID=1329 RepID=UPI0024AD8476|nr:LCP family protein [Streptococcus canis]